MIDAGEITFRQFAEYMKAGEDFGFDIVPEDQELFDRFMAWKADDKSNVNPTDTQQKSNLGEYC